MAAGHIEPSTSPWNTPVFVIRKQSGKWRLLQDLRVVNKTMVPMEAFHPGLLSPVAIPRGHVKLVIDLKDCFFSIPLHPEDCKRFAFSLPIVNCVGPSPPPSPFSGGFSLKAWPIVPPFAKSMWFKQLTLSGCLTLTYILYIIQITFFLRGPMRADFIDRKSVV